MEVRFLKPTDAKMLEEFVVEHPDGFIEQTWAWGELQTTVPGRVAFYVWGVFEDSRLVGSMLVIRQHMAMDKCWLWCPRGPLLPEKDRSKVWNLLKQEVSAIARKEGDVYLRIEPGAREGDDWPVKGAYTKDRYVPGETMMIDLTREEESIRAQMTQKGRYNIKQAVKAGVYVVKSDMTDFRDFWDMMEETAERDGFHLHSRNFYESFYDILGNKVHVYLAKIDKETVAGMFGVGFGDTFVYYFGASSDSHRKAYAPYALQWFAIESAKRHGYKWYDFLGVAPEGDERHSLAGVTQFKSRFGGRRVKYKEASVLVFKPFWWIAVKLAKARVR
ncbi:peptidoglycan bridge formation glycyltransferase FemA/FemB family protein [Patescibacteria group bacterium]|nr:peptidoglycan bridge formation glycyltransferase FemA/FemB family protein [Patescibacteria group bacterium]